MSRAITYAELRRLLKGEPLARPPIDEDAAVLLDPATVALIERVGLPECFAGRYLAPHRVAIHRVPSRVTYKVGEQTHPFGRAVIVGEIDHGFVLVPAKTGHVVAYEKIGVKPDMSLVTSFTNTSLDRFLYCMGRFLQSAANDFEDAREALEDCRAVDPIALEDREGLWSTSFEEAINGLY